MSKAVTLLALIGTLTFGMTTYFNYRVYRRLEEDRDTTIEMFFLRSEIKNSLKKLLVAILLFGISATVSIIGLRMENIVLAQGIRIGSVALFVAYMMFFLTLYLSTNPRSSFRDMAPWLVDETGQDESS